MDCSCSSHETLSRLEQIEAELMDMADAAKRLLRVASDPVSAVIKFLHDQPENVSLAGVSVRGVLLNAFGSSQDIPGLVRLLSGHVREIVRNANTINIRNEHLFQERWAGYLVKLKEQIKFEVGRENNKLVLKNIQGLFCIENGLELPVDKILINPPKLEITVKLGLLRPMRTVDIG